MQGVPLLPAETRCSRAVPEMRPADLFVSRRRKSGPKPDEDRDDLRWTAHYANHNECKGHRRKATRRFSQHAAPESRALLALPTRARFLPRYSRSDRIRDCAMASRKEW